MGRFDRENRTIGPIVAPPSVSPPISDLQRGGRFSRDIHGYTPKPGPGDIDWSRMNAPKGEAGPRCRRRLKQYVIWRSVVS